MYWDSVLKGVKGMEDNSSAAWNGGKGPSWLVQHVQLSDQQFGFHPKLWHKKKLHLYGPQNPRILNILNFQIRIVIVFVSLLHIFWFEWMAALLGRSNLSANKDCTLPEAQQL